MVVCARSVIAWRILFVAMGCSMLAALLYTLITDGSPFRRELLTPWLSAILIDFYVKVVPISIWVVYKEQTWFGAFLWVALLVCFGSITTCTYIAKQFFDISLQEPVYDPVSHVLLRNDRERKLMCFSVVFGRVLFSMLAVMMLVIIIYTAVTDGLPFRMELLTPIITNEAVRNIGVLFKQEIKGPWVYFSKYPKEELDVLFDRFKESGYTYTCSNEDLKAAFTDHIKRNYADWMWNLRKPIFEKYKSTGERYANRPENVPDPAVWNAMVDEWLNPQWQDQSNSNKTNRGKSTIVHTTGSVSFAKFKKDELDQTGIEPSPIECFKKFHISKGKEEEGEIWRSEKAKEIYEAMEKKKYCYRGKS